MKFSPFDKNNKNSISTDTGVEPLGTYLLSDQDVFDYYVLKSNYLREFDSPKSSYVPPKESDYTKGSYTRFFIKKRNDEYAPIIELDESQYKKMSLTKDGVDKNLFYGIEIIWKLTGPENDIINNDMIVSYGIIDTNERTLANKEFVMPGITDKLKNLKEFSRII